MRIKSLEHFAAKKTSYGYPFKRPYQAADLSGVVGIEMELEGTGFITRVPFRGPDGEIWLAKEDGSLRGGLEYITSTAIAPSLVQPMLEALFDGIDKAGGRINNSSRCSTHIHLNMQGFKVNQLASFVTLWGIFEEVLVNWCGPSRIGNLFALRLKDTARGVRIWQDFIQTGKNKFSADYKYMALNGSRLRDLGTFEIRSLEGCTSPDRPVKWIEALLAIRTLAETWDQSPALFIDRAMDEPRVFFEQLFNKLPIFPELIEANVEDFNTDIERAIENGAKMMLPTANALDWDKIIPLSKEVYIPNPFGSSGVASFEEMSFDPPPPRASRRPPTWDLATMRSAEPGQIFTGGFISGTTGSVNTAMGREELMRLEPFLRETLDEDLN